MRKIMHVLNGILFSRLWNQLFDNLPSIHYCRIRSRLPVSWCQNWLWKNIWKLYGNVTWISTFTCSHTSHKVWNTGAHYGLHQPVYLNPTWALYWGTQYVHSQIARNFMLWRQLLEKAKSTIASSRVQSSVEKKYFSKKIIRESVTVLVHPPVQDNVAILGQFVISKLRGNLSNCFWSYKHFLLDRVHSQNMTV